MANQEMTVEAPGGPGMKAKWTSSAKSGIGKAFGEGSQVTFTLSHGILNEVYFPREDTPCIRDMEFLVTDGREFFSEEKRNAKHETLTMGDGVPAYQITNTCDSDNYVIIKEIITDPIRNTILQKISFRPTVNDPLRLYALLAPHLNNNGDNNSGWIENYKGVPMLFAKSGDCSLALACSVNWKKMSVGYVGTSDGWTDLQKHKKMMWEFQTATNGNIALTGEIDISESSDFILAIGFGRTPSEAANHAWGSILNGFDAAKKKYIESWAAWLGSLRNSSGSLFKKSASVLRMHQAKTFPGGIIASLSIPWGDSKEDAEKSGYHMVWPRDLVESAGGFLALHATEDALQIINYLMSSQEANGSWPQNMWLEGLPHWGGVQMDQTALPILLIDVLLRHHDLDQERREAYWPKIKKAISYLITNGPATLQDRWEEESGYSPYTLATEVSGLVAAADLALANHDKELAKYCLETADYWNENIETWTYVTGTTLAKEVGVEGYYIRVNPSINEPASSLGDKVIEIKNRKNGDEKVLASALISVDALALVRFGLRSATDPKILNTIRVIDALLKIETPGGPCWHRYNHDGYGEDEFGNPFDGAGIGRAWPLLTGERGHYEIAAGNIEGAIEMLKAMENFANHGLIPEQIWDTTDLPGKDYFFGKHSGSAMPLTWAHSEYIKLCQSINDKKIFDMPPQTQNRYINKKSPSSFQVWRFAYPCTVLPENKILRIELLANAIIHWTDDHWKTTREIDTKDFQIGIFVADLKPSFNKWTTVEFTFFWPDENRWENINHTVTRSVLRSE